MSSEGTLAKEIANDHYFVGRTYTHARTGCAFIIEAVDRESVTIRDLQAVHCGMSVADGADGIVLRFLVLGLLTPGRRLFFYDSAGDRDEIVWQGPASESGPAAARCRSPPG